MKKIWIWTLAILCTGATGVVAWRSVNAADHARRDLTWGYTYLTIGLTEIAGEHFSSAVRDEPDSFEARLLLGLAYDAQHFYDAALSEYEALLARHPEKQFVWSYVGDVYLRQGKPVLAIEAFEKALAWEEDLVRPYVGRALAAEALGQTDRAEESYRRALEMGPTNVTAAFRLGSILTEKNSFEEAIEVLEPPLSLAESNLDYQYLLGSAYEAHGSIDKALTRYEWVLRADPGHAKASAALARLRTRQ